MKLMCGILFVTAVVSSPVFISNESTPRDDITSCLAPDNLEELFRRLNTNVNVSMFLHYGNMSANSSSFTQEELNTIQGHGSQTCPDAPSDHPEAPLSERSLCPWYYNITELPSGHYPRFIPQAVCKCTNCIDGILNQCSRISTKLHVLEYIGCESSFSVYSPKIITHYAGCTCTARSAHTL